MTLKELIQECLYRIDEEIGDFKNLTDKEQVIVNKLKTGINYMYKKLAREKKIFLTSQKVKLDNNIFNTEYLINTFVQIKRIVGSNGEQLQYKDVGDGEVEVKTRDEQVTVYYYYQPEALSSMSDETEFPPRIDDMILVYYASSDYLNMEGENEEMVKAQLQLNLFNDAYENIKTGASYEKIFDNYGGDYID